jgi:hypothetical protein
MTNDYLKKKPHKTFNYYSLMNYFFTNVLEKFSKHKNKRNLKRFVVFEMFFSSSLIEFY